jgi:hypothetical protein
LELSITWLVLLLFLGPVVVGVVLLGPEGLGS